jgi:hypothetical protein
MHGPYVEEPLHGRDCRAPTAVPPSPLGQLMMQSDATLNMMRLCCLKSLLFAYIALEGTFLFDAMLMAPLGTEVLVHQKPGHPKCEVIMPPKQGTSPMPLPTTIAFVSS